MRKAAGHRTRGAVVAALCALLCFLSGCARQTDAAGNTVQFYSTWPSGYGQALAQTLPGVCILPSRAYLFDDLNDGCICCTFDVQAETALAAGAAARWQPQYLSTAVIAVDRAQTSVRIRGWEDLRSIPDPVGFSNTKTETRLLLAAISYGYAGEDFSPQPAISLLADIAAAGRLRPDDASAPVLLLFDDQAAQLQKEGRDLEIIVPAEGTLSYAKGLLSRGTAALPTADRAALLAAGLRLTDGAADPALYPQAAAYTRAARLADYTRLARETQHYDATLRRFVLHSRLYSSADQLEHMLFAGTYILIVIFWFMAVLHRVVQPQMRRLLVCACLLIIGWVLLRYIKYQPSADPVFTRCCWYLYYFFQMLLPVTVAWLAWSLDSLQPRPGGRPWKLMVGILYGLLLALVLTNDLHQLVFRLDLAHSPDGGTYSYGPLFLLVYAACVAPAIVSIALLAKKVWQSPRRSRIAIPIGVGVLLLGYGAAFVLGVPFARNSDFTMTICVCFLAYFESAMRTGLLPVNTRYNRLFRRSPLNMQIVDGEGRTAYASDSAQPVGPQLWAVLRANFSKPVALENDRLLYADPIPGGAVVWQEDVARLDAMRRETQENIRRLQAANALLAAERDDRAEKARGLEKTALLTSVEREIRGQLAQLIRRVEALPQTADRHRETARIALLLCCIKRRCNLLFRKREQAPVPAEELCIYFDELAVFAGYAQVHANTANALGQRELPARQAALFYEFFYTALAALSERDGGTLLGQLTVHGGMELRLLSSAPLAVREAPGPRLAPAIRRAGGRVETRTLDDGQSLILMFPEGGGAQ